MSVALIFKQSIRHLLVKWQSSLIVFLSMSICIFSSFILCEGMFFSSNFLSQMEIYKRTYSLNMPSYYDDIDAGYSLTSKLLYGDAYSNIHNINSIQASPVKNENVKEYITPELYIEKNNRYAVYVNLQEGRNFSTEEIVSGDNVIIVGINAGKKVGDIVALNDTNYRVIGISETAQSFITYNNAYKSRDFILSVDNVEFSKILSESEEASLNEDLTPFGCISETFYSSYLSDFVIQTLLYIFVMILIFFCTSSIISELFRYMVESREYEFGIYKVLGINTMTLTAFFYLPIGIISCFSFGIGLFLYRISEPIQNKIGFDNSLSLEMCFTLMVFIVIILFATTLPLYTTTRKKDFESW